MQLQDQLIKKRTVEVETVHQTVKSKLLSYSSFLQKNCSEALAAVKKPEEKGDRSSNVIVFGVPWLENNKPIESKDLDLLERLEE